MLDMLAGGALSRFSIMGLAVYAYVIGRIAALNMGKDILGERKVHRYTTILTAVAAPVLAVAWVTFGVDLGSTLAAIRLAIADVASLTAGAMLFVFLAHLLPEELGATFLVGVNIITSLPRYVFQDLRANLIFVLFTLVITVALQVLFLKGERRIPLREFKRLEAKGIYLPISLDRSGVLPALFPLAAFGLMRLGASELAGSGTGWIHWLASTELQLTDSRSPRFWVLLFLVAVPMKMAFDYAKLSPVSISDQFRKLGLFIPGVRPGNKTGTYVRQIWIRVAWLSPIVMMFCIACTAIYYCRQHRTGLWPLALLMILCAIQPIVVLARSLRASAISSRYEGFTRGGSIRGGGPKRSEWR
jgi:preprotein translocase subunit SecY